MLLITASIFSAAPAEAAGCLKGAVVGGVAGHYMNHHGLLGATAGCLIGRHEANKQIRQQNQLTITLGQTFEAKMKDRATKDLSKEQQAQVDTASSDSTTATLDAPRHLPQARKIMLLSLQTSAVAYDFVLVPDSLRGQLGRDRYGLSTTTLTNSVQSDLLRGF